MNPQEAALRGYAFKKSDVVRWYRQENPVQEAVSKAVTDIQKSVTKRLETAGGNAARTAGKAVLTAAAGVGVKTIALNVAKASVVGLAGFAAYWLTSKLRTLRYRTYAELRYEAANWYRRARAAAAEKAGRPLTGAELQQFKQWYDARIGRINASEAAGQPVSGAANLIFGDD